MKTVAVRVRVAYQQVVVAARGRSPVLDHWWRAQERYRQLHGERLAAASAYYGFFAVFALILVAYSVFDLIQKRNPTLLHLVLRVVREYYLPFINVEEIGRSSGTVGVIGLLVLASTGLRWVQAVRSSQRLIHGLEQEPRNRLTRALLDLAVLIGFLILFGISAGTADGVIGLLAWLLGRQEPVLRITVWLLGLLVNGVLAAALLVAVPRLRLPPRRVRWAVLSVGVGITLLNTAGHSLVSRVTQSPAYTVVAGAAAVLLYLYLLHRMLLIGAALVATSRNDRYGAGAAGRADAGSA